MTVATNPPAQLRLSFVTNHDNIFALKWRGPADTPIPITTAVCTLEFEQPATTWVDGEPVPPPAAERHVIDTTDPASPAGHIDATYLPNGDVVITIPPGIWASYTQRDGILDVVAVATSGTRRCLGRGPFTAEQGVST